MVSCLVWNVQGDSKRGVENQIKTFARIYNVKLMAILEPGISGHKAVKVAKSFGFDKFHLEHARGISGEIWVFLKGESC